MAGKLGDWPRLSLREANVLLIDCDHRTPPATEAGYPYVAIPQLRNGRVELSHARRITPEHYVQWTRKAKPRPYDVVLSRRCNPGETAVVERGAEFALGQNLVLLRADGTKVYPPFLRWLVRGPEWWEQIGKFINVGAVFDSLKCADIPRFGLRVPTLAAQRAIADILGTLDDKIDLNRCTNETLEGIARAIFESWFVDFDPVRAKAEGRQPLGMNAETAALFPATLSETTLGLIPKGWKACPLGDICEFAYGKALKEEDRRPGRIPVFGSNGQVGWHDTSRVRGPGVVIGRKGNPGLVKWAAGDFFPIDTTFYVLTRDRASLFYLFHLLETLDLPLLGSDSAVPGLNRSIAYMSKVVAPPPAVQHAFERLAAPLRHMENQRGAESRTLAELRDALLPKLLSGEIRIRDAEKIVEARV